MEKTKTRRDAVEQLVEDERCAVLCVWLAGGEEGSTPQPTTTTTTRSTVVFIDCELLTGVSLGLLGARPVNAWYNYYTWVLVKIALTMESYRKLDFLNLQNRSVHRKDKQKVSIGHSDNSMIGAITQSDTYFRVAPNLGHFLPVYNLYPSKTSLAPVDL